MILRTLLLLILLVPVQCLRAALAEQTRRANGHLSAGRVAEALSSYRALLTSPEFRTAGSPEIWYNRGLAEERSGNPVAASLSYRRALLLDPTLVPAQRALAGTMSALGIPENRNWMSRFPSLISPEILVIVGAFLGWSGVILFLLLVFLARRRRGLILLSLILLVLGHGASVFGTLADPRRTASSRAVITSKTAPVLRSTPSDNSDARGTIPPGSPVSILSRNGPWWYVAAGPGLFGWISSSALTPLLESKGSL
jgi:hypothetical protein